MLRLLRSNRNLFIYFVGQLTSQVGTTMSLIALPLLTWELTSSVFSVSVVVACMGAPGILLSSFLGPVLDRLDRQRAMVASELVRMTVFLVACIPVFAGTVHPWMLCVLGAVSSISLTFLKITEKVILVYMVGREELNSANAAMKLAIQCGGIVGAPVAAAVVTYWGYGPVLVMDGLSFGISAFSVAVLALPAMLSAQALTRTRRYVPALREGLHAFWHKPTFKMVLFVATVTNFAYYPVPALLPDISGRAYLDWPALSREFAMASLLASHTAGRLVGSFAVDPLRRLSVPSLLVAFALTVAASLGTIGLSQVFTLSCVAMAAIGMCGTISTVRVESWVQQSFDPAVLGRIFTLVLTFCFGLSAPALLVGGLLADRMGSSFVLVLLAWLLLGAALLGLMKRQLLILGDSDETGSSTRPAAHAARLDRPERHPLSGLDQR